MRRKLNNYKPQVAQENNFLQRYVYNNKLSINDLKVFKAILSKVKYNDSLFEDSYMIDYKTLDIAGVPSNNNRYQTIEKSLVKLMNTFVTIRKEDRKRLDDPILKKAKGGRTLGLIRNDWIHDKKSSKIVITIPDILKPFFLELADKEYTIYALENISSFSSVYELKLYELFAKWKNRGFFNITLKNLREYLELEDDKYPRYANFKARVLKKAIENITKKTNLSIVYRELKENGDIITKYRGAGNRVYSIEFVITDKDDFNASNYIAKTLKLDDGLEYIILEIDENEDGLLQLKLYDKKHSMENKLVRPISKEELMKYVLL